MMKRNFEKSIHILNQLMGYCKKAGGVEIDAKLILEDEHAAIKVSSYITGLDEKTITDLCKQIEIPRQEEIEQDCWNIGLSGSLGDEIALVGMMTDLSEVCYENNILTISVRRQN